MLFKVMFFWEMKKVPRKIEFKDFIFFCLTLNFENFETVILSSHNIANLTTIPNYLPNFLRSASVILSLKFL